eukprot:m.112199 g.112199  ORF g.112199 m.112199 type:complete len:258 (-) comp9108_c0_seq2:2565-3338(-)
MTVARAVLLLALCASAAAWLDFYEIIKLEPPTTRGAVKKAFRARALELHPDKNPAADAEARFRDLVDAYETLGDDGLRRTYDATYAHMKEQAKMKKPAPPSPPKPSGQGRPRPDYKTFYRDFDENMRKHFEEHMRAHQKATGISDMHMQAHLDSLAAAHAHAQAIHEQAHAAAMGIAHEHARGHHGNAHAHADATQHLLDGLFDGAEDDDAAREHVEFLKRQKDYVKRTTKSHSRSCSTIVETVNGVSTERVECTES